MSDGGHLYLRNATYLRTCSLGCTAACATTQTRRPHDKGPPPLHRRQSGVWWRRSREHGGGENPPGICEARCLSLLQRALRFSCRVPLARGIRAPPGAGRDPLEEMYGVRMVDLESLFFVLIETFGEL
ncbi:hypothetical protein PAPYR_5460 [Paratrimastix pyriformis]|uniref:Uncharacterized protein n=1 Tax=Paratrimastix pyriformis TaxID=342808 RepID=A0ABQ8UHJ4_9EUKA|nr:hypothetical protein PAPYR_5460 [Paratrimastix pyriformis]